MLLLRGSNPQKTILGAWIGNRHFQGKLEKSKNMHIIENTGTASIPTKLCTAIKTTKAVSSLA